MRESFFNRMTNLTAPPQDMWEGALKGLIYSSFATAMFVTMPLGYEPKYAKAVVTFFLACTFIGASWGLNNQINREAQERALNPGR